MDIAIEQLSVKLAARERAIVLALGKQGRVIIANVKSKHSYTSKNKKEELLSIIKDLDEVCQERTIKI